MSAYKADGTDPTDPWGIPPVHDEPPWNAQTAWDTPPVPAQPGAAQRVRVSGPFEALPEDAHEDRGHGTLMGALAGVVSAAAALGVANLVAAFVRPEASPIIAVGDAFIGSAPSWLKNLSVQYFGASDKNALLVIALYAAYTLLAMVIGIIAWRHVSVGVVALALFGAFGAYVAVTRPGSQITDVIPSAAGGLTGMAAISVLAWVGRSRKSRPRTSLADW